MSVFQDDLHTSQLSNTWRIGCWEQVFWLTEMEDVSRKVLTLSLSWPRCIFNHEEPHAGLCCCPCPGRALPIPLVAAAWAGSSAHFTFHLCYNAKSCQSTLKLLYFPSYGTYVTHGAEQTRTPAPGVTDNTHQPLFHTPRGFDFRHEGHTDPPPLTSAPISVWWHFSAIFMN